METFYGSVETSEDANKLFKACKIGLLPQVQHRLSLNERQSIRPGSVFVWDDQNSHIQRWTDGRAWGTCRPYKGFLSYQEMTSRFSKDKVNNKGISAIGYKPDGMIKRTFCSKNSVGVRYFLVAYSQQEHMQTVKLGRPVEDLRLSHIGSFDEACEDIPQAIGQQNHCRRLPTPPPQGQLPALASIFTPQSHIQHSTPYEDISHPSRLDTLDLRPLLNVPNSSQHSPYNTLNTRSTVVNHATGWEIGRKVVGEEHSSTVVTNRRNASGSRSLDLGVWREKKRGDWKEDQRMLEALWPAWTPSLTTQNITTWGFLLMARIAWKLALNRDFGQDRAGHRLTRISPLFVERWKASTKFTSRELRWWRWENKILRCVK